MEKSKAYLGDGAYVVVDDRFGRGGLKIFTSNGISVTNEVFLESEGIALLIRFAMDNCHLPPILFPTTGEKT